MPRKAKAKKVDVVVVNQPRKPRARGQKNPLSAASYGSAFAPVQSVSMNSVAAFKKSYRLQRNNLQGVMLESCFNTGGQGVRIRHREFIKNIAGSVAFLNSGANINPGLSSVFPWLSTVASSFEEYDFLGLNFKYRPTSGSAVSGTNPALGVVVLATDYNVLNPLFGSKQVMETYEFSNSSVPFAQCIHGVECKPRRNVLDSLYVRSGAFPPDSDPRLYDIGLFQIATEGMQINGGIVGELWVEYDVVLKKARSPAVTSGGGDDPVPENSFIHVTEYPYGTSSLSAGFFGNAGGQILAGALSGASIQAPSSITLSNPGYYVLFALGASDDSPITWIGDMSPIFGSNIGPADGGIFLGQNYADVGLVQLDTISTTDIAARFLFIQVTSSGGPATNYVSFSNTTGMNSGSIDVFVFAYYPKPSAFSRPIPAPRQRPSLLRTSDEKHEDMAVLVERSDVKTSLPLLRSSVNRWR